MIQYRVNSTWNAVIFMLLLLFMFSINQQTQAFPSPYPSPHARAAQSSLAQENQFGQIFDKTQFKPPELEETIDEVQKILQKDPSLPRLTRGEIEELYEKVTREEYEKSIESGDVGRADSMRALMLVLPYNTDNSTADHLQELYTRPPVTKVIDGYTQHPPIQFVTPNLLGRNETYASGQLAATTYKPGFPANVGVSPTTYHPPPAPILHQITPETHYDFQPMFSQQSGETAKPIQQRYSSHYNAKNADFLKLNGQKQRKQFSRTTSTSTVRPVPDVLKSLGIVGPTQSRKQFTIDDYYPAESAPRPVISSFIPLNGDFDGLRGQNIAPRITPEAYTSFKPLNIGEEIRVQPEVEDYLTRFGIVGGRKRKALKKNTDEQSIASSELSPARLPNNRSNKELQMLLENLQELERLNAANKKKSSSKAATPPRTTTSTSTTTTTTTTTEAPTTEAATPSLITNGVPMLIEPKKPRRRIDPHLDLNYGASNNQQTIATNEDQLAKLLENLQELEKLRGNPENVSKKVAPTVKPIKVATKPITTTTTTTTTTPATLILSSGPQNELTEIQRILRQFQAAEAASTRTTTKKPILRQNDRSQFDLSQLRKLLTDDNELERLYEQARGNVAPKTTKPTTTTTSTTTTTTPKPWTDSFELDEIQKYIAQLDKARTSTTSTSTSTSTTTTTTTPRPKTTTTTPTPTKQTSTDDVKIQELISRVQQLERLNSEKPKTSTESSMPYLGFTSRNVKKTASSVKATPEDFRVPSNDFAQLQQLYKQVQEADRASFGQVEISTAATASKYGKDDGGKQSQDLAQQLIDFTNDAGSGTSFPDVHPNDFVHLQKLLSKVQELERVKINANGVVESYTVSPRKKTPTYAPSLVTAASKHSPNVKNPSAQFVYPESSDKYVDFVGNTDDLKFDYEAPIPKKSTVNPKKDGASSHPLTSSEELRELIYSKPVSPKQAALDKDFEKYQEFFSSLEDAGDRQTYRTSYQNMEPPVIQKTVTKEPPRFFPTKKPQNLVKETNQLSNNQQSDLNELQKLLSHAQELDKLGVTLPKTLSDRIEAKLTKTTDIPNAKPTKSQPKEPTKNVYLDRYGLKPKTTVPPIAEASEKVAVFSLTTSKPPAEKSIHPTTNSPYGVPVFSATKIIEAAIKQAVNRIAVTTEQPQGFRRRSDEDVADLELEDNDDEGYGDGDDMMGEFSEMDYQITIPDINRMGEVVDESKVTKSAEIVKPGDITEDLGELQRLIGNLQELQKLNVSISTDMLRLADTKYLNSLKTQVTNADESAKTRRQSATPAVATASPSTVATTESSNPVSESDTSTPVIAIPTTPTAPTLINLGIGIDNADADTAESNDKLISSSTTSTTSTTTTEGTTTTEESRNGSLSDLEASFGPDPNKEEPLPPQKKNGFYFLADWNSFLEVGDGDDQVIVRFSPKIGDPRLFLPVKTP